MFLGRDAELAQLRDLWTKEKARLVAIRGRRRIGKSTLVETFGREADCFWEFQGLPPREGISRKEQLAAFSETISRQTRLPALHLESWPQAFALLTSQIRNEKTVILLDEISWMAEGDKDFAGHLKTAWDTELIKKANLVVVLCGSVSSWIESNILNSTGFVGRISLQIDLGPLPLNQCDRLWGAYRQRIASKEKLKILSVTGGVPRYLEEIKPKLTPETNIRNLCFDPAGLLFNDFGQIFNSVFSRRTAIYGDILKALLPGTQGLSVLADQLKKTRNGILSEYLRDLEISGFIRKDCAFKFGSMQDTRLFQYRLSDNYSRFYLYYIKPRIQAITRGGLDAQTPLERLIRWDVILGLQFENLVLANLPLVHGLLNIKPGTILNSSPYFQRKTLRQEACQVDLLIQTEHALYVCEIKCRKAIGVEIIEEMQEKIRKMAIPRGFSVRPILIAEGDIDKSVSGSGYFDSIVKFEDLLK